MNGISAVAQSAGIVPVETELPWVFQFENVLSPQVCDAAVAHIANVTQAKRASAEIMPWEDGDAIAWRELADGPLKAHLYAYRLLLTQMASHCFQTILYPTFTDLVLWRAGRSQGEHKDDGYDFPEDDELAIRKVSSVTYLNEGFEGGETFFRGAGDIFHLNTPKRGSVVLFASDERCPHGVLEVKSGIRVTLPIWFTDSVAHCERDNGMANDAIRGVRTRQQPPA
jgi:2-oxoglutarate-Fe(II)-dependent oxygenase superfamily protein